MKEFLKRNEKINAPDLAYKDSKTNEKKPNQIENSHNPDPKNSTASIDNDGISYREIAERILNNIVIRF